MKIAGKWCFAGFCLLAIFLIFPGCISTINSPSAYVQPESTAPASQTIPATLSPTNVPASISGSAINSSEYTPGLRTPGQWFSWRQENASGTRATQCHFTVYDRKFIDGPYHAWIIMEQAYRLQYPPSGMKWLVVWANRWCEDGSQDSWSVPPTDIVVSYQGQQFLPSPILYERTSSGPETAARVCETQSHSTLSAIEEYRKGGATLTLDPYGFQDGYSLEKVQAGRSNAWDGWIIYAVPAETDLSELRVTGDFGANGSVSWYLVNRTPTAPA